MRAIHLSSLAVFWAIFWPSSRQGAVAGVPELYGSETRIEVNDRLVRIDPTTGQHQVIGPFEFDVQGLAYVPDLDQLYGLSAQTRRVYRIDRTTAATTVIGTSPHPFGNANGLAYDSLRQRLIGSSNQFSGSDTHLFAIDPLTGAYTGLAAITGATNVEGLGYDPVSDTLYGLADLENRLVSIDPLSGIATNVIDLPSRNWRGLEYDVLRQVLYATVSVGGDLYEISLLPTPTWRFIGFTAEGTQGLAVVPEPGAVAGIICAAAMIVSRRRSASQPRTCFGVGGCLAGRSV